METGTLEKKIAKLPDDLKLKVEGFVDELLNIKVTDNADENIFKIQKGFGGGKGIFGKIADDFDEPLEIMKDYM